MSNFPQQTALFTEENIEAAYRWLCKQRTHFPPNADIWPLRFHWEAERVELLQRLNDETYQLSPQQAVTKADGKTIHLWSSLDALVLKAMAMILPDKLQIHPGCTHIKGHGGLKATVRNLQEALPAFQFVMKTDVKDYYGSIDHDVLLARLREDIDHPFLFRLLWQFTKRIVEHGGLYRDVQRGITRGCALSPLIGAYYLRELDERLSVEGVHYARYMDDIVLLAKTRWQLRRAVRTLNRVFNTLKVWQHPDKTFIGRIARGFDFLGYHFGTGPLRLAKRTIGHMLKKAHWLYEQQLPGLERDRRLSDYLRRWERWVTCGLANVVLMDSGIAASFAYGHQPEQ